MKLHVALSTAVLLAAAAACSVGTSIDRHACPTGGTTLTYQNFGSGFFAAWCIRCHGGPNGYSSRSFTTLDDIRQNKDRIFVNAAADNSFMPPGPDGPTTKERDDLADWLACGAP
jgi:hypothetical protein